MAAMALPFLLLAEFPSLYNVQNIFLIDMKSASRLVAALHTLLLCARHNPHTFVQTLIYAFQEKKAENSL